MGSLHFLKLKVTANQPKKIMVFLIQKRGFFKVRNLIFLYENGKDAGQAGQKRGEESQWVIVPYKTGVFLKKDFFH